MVLGAVVLLCVIGFTLYRVQMQSANSTRATTETFPYVNDTYGISFKYPITYTLTQFNETNTQSASGKQHVVTIIETKLLEDAPENGEGPVSITVDIYPNPTKMSVDSWIKTKSQSNFNLSVDKKTYETQIDGEEALAYTWDGLYRGNSFVFAHKGNIFLVSGTYMNPEDRILLEFTELLKSIELR